MRFLVSCLAAPVITFSLLLFMAGLINQGTQLKQQKQDNPYFDLVVNAKDESFESRERRKLEPPKPKQQQTLEPVALVQNNVASPDIKMDLNIPSLDLSSHVSAMSITMPGIESMELPVAAVAGETMATPLYREQPRYPPKAIRLGKQGYVTLSFDINEAGRVVNIKVIEAKPKRLFDREAKRALKKWKYKPMLVNGEAVSQLGQKIRLDFQLENGK